MGRCINKRREKLNKIKLNETFSGEVIFTDKDALCESDDFSSVVDGTNIIGLVEGQFFQPDGMSRNKRWYSRELWEKVLACADVRSRLANRTMYGEIGHSDGPVTDMTLRDGNVSHIIADLWIDEKGRGMGRAYILDTPKGRLLKTYLGAKSKLKVSTRGEGVYLDGKLHDGYPIIDPDTYELQTVDFVLNPGFLETNARLTTQKENFTPEIKQVNETTIEKGDNTMDMDKYVTELKEQISELKAENKTLSEELKSKEKELLESKFEESAEIKKINEAYAPFKKLGVSAKTLNETLKSAQKSLQKTKANNAKLTEELKAYKDRCGESIEDLDEALEMSKKALDTVAEYQKLGTVAEIKELMAQSEALVPKLKQLASLTEYKKLGTVEDLKSMVERVENADAKVEELTALDAYKKLGSIEDLQKLSAKCEAMLPKLSQLTSLKEYRKLGTVEDLKSLMENCENSIPKLKVLEEYKKLGTIEDIKKLSRQCESMLSKLKELDDAKKLAENVQRILPKLQKLKEMKSLEESAAQAHKVIKQYIKTVGSIKEAKALVESRKETIKDTIKKVNIKEVLEVSNKFGCTVENAAKLIRKYGADKATKLLEAETSKKKPVETTQLAESKKLVEEAGELDKVNVEKPAESKSAENFLKTGMIVNGFNQDALGKRTIHIENLDKLDGTKVKGENQAKELLKQLKDMVEVEKEPEVKVEPNKAEEIAKKLLK